MLLVIRCVTQLTFGIDHDFKPHTNIQFCYLIFFYMSAHMDMFVFYLILAVQLTCDRESA